MKLDKRYKLKEEIDMELVNLYTKKGMSWEKDNYSNNNFDSTVGKGLNLLVKKGIDALNDAAGNWILWKYPQVDLSEKKGFVPYNFMGYAPWKVHGKCTVGEAVDVAARLSGWMVAATKFPVLMAGLRFSMHWDGMDSPKTTINLWKVYDRRSPGEAARRMRAINEKARVLLGNSTDKWPSRTIVLKLALGKLPVRKAAIIAACTCMDNNRVYEGLIYRSNDGVIEGMEEVKRAKETLINFLNVRRLQYLGWRAVGWKPKCDMVYTDTPPYITQALKGQGDWLRKAAWKYAPEGGHDQIALIQLAALFGCPKELNGFISKGAAVGISVHDLGINLNKEYSSGVKEWFLRVTGGSLNTTTLSDAIKVANNWNWLVGEGWNPNEKGSVKKGVELACTAEYEDIKDKVFAVECGKVGVSKHDYQEYERKWMMAQKTHRMLSIPAPGGVEGISDGDLTIRMLDKSDPTALFIGEYTGCCQHPGGAGANAAWYSVDGDNAGVWVVSYKGTIVAQSLVWRNFDMLILDNIEAIGHETIAEKISSIYIKACKAVKGVFGIDSVWLGNNNDVDLPTDHSSQKRNAEGVPFYTDAKTVKMVITD